MLLESDNRAVLVTQHSFLCSKHESLVIVCEVAKYPRACIRQYTRTCVAARFVDATTDDDGGDEILLSPL